MKNNFFRAALFFVAVSIILASCSHDDNELPQTPPQAFFNLNAGSQWIYKKYVYNAPSFPNDYYDTGVVDTVTVVGTEMKDGLTYTKLSYKSSNSEIPSYQFVRVNNLGHLIKYFTDENDGPAVLHPGFDTAFEEDKTFPYGSIHFFLEAAASITVENQSYTVLPYKGNFTPTGETAVTKTISYDCKPGLGLVREIIHPLAGNHYFENRLVSYHLN